MVIYYTHSFTNTGDESHRLLTKAIAAYLKVRDMSADAAGEAKRMTSGLSTYGEFGKPFIPGFAPFSISHSNGTWAVLISEKDVYCGLDVQYERKADVRAIARRFYASEDAEIIAHLIEKDTGSDGSHCAADREFFRLWARREALVKAIGTSVAESDLPAVYSGRAEYGGELYIIEDVEIPADGKLFASICFTDRGQGMVRPEIIEI